LLVWGGGGGGGGCGGDRKPICPRRRSHAGEKVAGLPRPGGTTAAVVRKFHALKCGGRRKKPILEKGKR